MDEEQTCSTTIKVATLPVTPAKAGNESGEDEPHEEEQVDVVLVLPPDDFVLAQVTDIGNTRLATWLEEHPANMSMPEAFMSVVGIEFGIGVSVVSTVASGPPLDRALNSAGTSQGKKVL
jgi:hypothetical protein